MIEDFINKKHGKKSFILVMSSFTFKLNAVLRRCKGKLTNITLLLMLVLEIKNPIHYNPINYLLGTLN